MTTLIARAIPYRFTGKEREGSEAAYEDYFGARYYSGAQGRFTSPDPVHHPGQSSWDLQTFLSTPQRWNAYAYVLNNPLGHTDPSGGEMPVWEAHGQPPRTFGQAMSDIGFTAVAGGAVAGTGAVAAASGGWLASAWQGLSALALGTAPRWEPIVVDAIEGYVNPAAGGRLTIAAGQTKLNAAEIDTGVRLAQQRRGTCTRHARGGGVC